LPDGCGAESAEVDEGKQVSSAAGDGQRTGEAEDACNCGSPLASAAPPSSRTAQQQLDSEGAIRPAIFTYVY